MANRQLKTIGRLYRESYAAVRRNLTLFIFLNTASILGVAWNIGLDIRDKSHGSNWRDVLYHSFNGGGSYPDTQALVGALLSAATIILALFLGILTYLSARQHSVQFSEVWSLFKKRWWRLVVTWILVAICIIAGFFLLIIPGIYLISRLALAPVVAIDEGTYGYDAVRRSWELTKGHAWVVFVTVFFVVILSLPSVIPVVGRIISLVLVTTYSVALPIRYFELKDLDKDGQD